MSKTYEQMHSGLHWYRGPASGYPCLDCGAPAKDWAYRYTSPDREILDAKGRRYSEDFGDYEPMCRSCHRRFDMLRPERRAFQLEHLKRIHAAAAEDPNYRGVMRQRGEKGRDELKRRRDAGEPVGKRSAEGLKELGRQVGNLRRRCLTCGMETSAGPLVRHQKTQGHAGYEEIK